MLITLVQLQLYILMDFTFSLEIVELAVDRRSIHGEGCFRHGEMCRILTCMHNVSLSLPQHPGSVLQFQPFTDGRRTF